MSDEISADAGVAPSGSDPETLGPDLLGQTPPNASVEPASESSSESSSGPYRVLARKYRPNDFQTLIGQEALVRILTNAIESGRIAQAFMLTGVRGVGKTTTARIIAKALNCTGPDGTGGPTPTPCGLCDNCRAIAEDRHLDVLELDAASNTGVDNIREVIDGARYRPVAARYKVYIFDEVHMLSKNAFNALLKTLEEPPEHVKFIFATTEIRKVPVTILSRCQRFDLRRVPIEMLFTHFQSIATAEGRKVEDAALTLVARAADGSVRDGLSILDQAIALSDGAVTAEQVRTMLGLADRALVFDLYEAVMAGQAGAALDGINGLYNSGADPTVILQDMLDLTHWLTRAKLTPEIAERASTPELERTRGMALASRLSMPILTRTWQMLLKGIDETRMAPSPIQAAEMALIRLMHAADLPAPGDLVKRLESAPPSSTQPSAQASAQPSTATPSAAPTAAAQPMGGAEPAAQSAARLAPAQEPSPAPERAALPAAETAVNDPPDFNALLALVEEKREGRLYLELSRNIHLVRYEPGRIEFRPTQAAARDLSAQLGQKLAQWTGKRWLISISRDQGAPTIADQKAEQERARFDAAARDPLVQAVMREFPKAAIKRVKPIASTPPPEASDADGDARGDDDSDPTR
ncbi:MAG: DNA polymerase III subunit gamma/tau [Alphaproteobacteria bacterium]|nr:DNA polymerase III subunit gamma/tau [Alphaproteobacteria bacterium]